MITNDQSDTNIVDLIGNFVAIKKKGAAYEGLCPFHTEKTPSFNVRSTKGNYKCFGCGRGGDAAQFLMEHEDMTYPEAIQYLADFSKIEVQYEKGKDVDKWMEAKGIAKEKQRALKPVVAAAWDYFRSHAVKLKVDDTDPEKVRIDFMGRSWAKETLDLFGYGVAPAKGLVKYAEKNNVNLESLIHLGLIYQKNNPDNTPHTQYDQFRNRHIIPIKDHNGVVVGFAGRRTKEKEKVKYINSAASDIYEKNKILFGFPENRKAIATSGEVILMEGYTDVMTALEFGYTNCLAKAGTALTVQQCKLIKRVSEKVILFGDHDAAGQAAAFRDVEVLLKNGLFPRVVIWPEDTPKSDPDSLLREEGGQDIFNEIIKNAQPGLIALVMHNLDKSDLHAFGAAIELAGRLLSYVEDDIYRNLYLDHLCKTKNLGNVRKKIQAVLYQLENEKLSSVPSSTGLDVIQEKDLNLYQIFIKKSSKDGLTFAKNGGVSESGHIYQQPITNFVLKPLYHVASRDNPTRMMTMTNKEGVSTIVEIPTDQFCELGTFRKFINRFGNYQIYGSCKANDFLSITAYVKDNMPTVYKITTLGWHKAGFFTWINGISLEGKFIPSQASGLVEHEGVQFLLPGRTYKTLEDDHLDDDSDEMEYLKLYKYKESRYTIEQHFSKFMEVHGPNSLVGLAYYFACCFHDIIYAKNRSFPHLNLYGPKGKGKSTIAWSMNYFFGSPRAAVLLDNFTKPGVLSRGRQIRNGLLWMDEYANDLDKWVLAFLRGLYDGTGKEKKKMGSGSAKATENESIHCGVVYSGQSSPTREPALFERSIITYFDYQHTDEGYVAYKDLQHMEKSGEATHYTQMIQALRQKFVEEYDKTFADCKVVLEQNATTKLSARILQNHCVLLTAAALVEDSIPLPKFNGIRFTTALSDKLTELMTEQTFTMSRSDELGEFWRIVDLLMNNKRKSSNYLENDLDYTVEEQTSVKVHIPNTKSDTEDVKFATTKKILFLHLNTAYSAYAQQLGTERSDKRSMSITDINYYLKGMDYFVGHCRAKRLVKRNGSVRVAMIDLSKFEDFDLPLSIDLRNKEEDFESADCPTSGKPRGKCNCDDCKAERGAPAF